MKIFKRTFTVILLALMLVCFTNIQIKVYSQVFEPVAGTNVKITFTQGDLPEDGATLFDDFSENVQINVSNNLIVPSTTFGNLIQTTFNDEFVSKKLDSETYYFNVSGEEWAYTFTGWHIVGTDDYLPAKTVFQPGDLILDNVLEQYVDAGTNEIKLEAVWGKCYFIRKPYSKMIYKNDSSLGVVLDEEASKTASNQTGPLSVDTNTGTKPTDAYATIDGLFATFRKNCFVDKTQDSTNAYKTVVMLADDIYYAKDNNKSGLAAIFGQQVGNKNQAEIAVTYKSLQTSGDGSCYKFYYKPKGYYNQVYGNIRFDNITFLSIPKAEFDNQSVGAEFQLFKVAESTYSYFETTYRYNSLIPSSNGAIVTFRPSNCNLVVVNGGRIGSMQTSWSTAINTPNTKYEWFVGRNAYITSAIHCGTTSAYADSKYTVNVKIDLTVTGGYVKSIYGGSKGMNVKTMSDRNIRIIGDGTTTKSQYNPQITDIFGGAEESSLYGNINLDILNTKLITNVYGGGDKYTATTYGNININIVNSRITGDLYGGGKNANSEINPETSKGGDVKINIVNSSVNGNVYGSGMGMTQSTSITENYATIGYATEWWNTSTKPNGVYIDGWENPMGYNNSGELDPTSIGYYPVYDQETGYVLVGSYKQVSWTEFNSQYITFKHVYLYAYLSLATVQNVNISIDNSVIGTSTNGKGNVYGGGSIAQVLGDTEINISGDDTIIYGSVYGAGDGVSVPGKVTVYKPLDKETYKAPYYTVTEVKNDIPKATVTNFDSQYKTSVYGEFTWHNDISLLDKEYDKGIDFENKYLYSPNTVGLGKVNGSTKVIVTGGTVKGAVYGGGNKGYVGGDSTVNIYENAKVETVFAGCNQSDVLGTATLNINLNDGHIITNAYGGNNLAGAINEVFVNVTNGQITNLFGGGNQADDDYTTTLDINGGTISYLYGGGSKATVGDINIDIAKEAIVQTLYGGGDQGVTLGNIVINSSADIETLYGGGNNAEVSGDITITLNEGSVDLFYGGGNQGITVGDINVTSNANFTTFFGGGNNAAVEGDITIILNEGIIDTFYGGGNKGEAEGSISVKSNADITKLYGGGNQATVFGNIDLDILSGTIDTLFGGGNQGRTEGSIIVDLSANVTTLYGGANKADIIGDIKLSISDSTITTLYGGNNITGNIYGTVSTELLNTKITTLYGGGSLADGFYDTTIIANNSDIKTLYGGGEQATIDNSIITINSGNFDNIYGGGYAGHVTDSTQITLNSGTINVTGNIYGGGFQGNVQNLSTIKVKNGNIGGNVYGGGYAGDVGSTSVTIDDSTLIGSTPNLITIEGSVFGGGEGQSATVYTSTKVLINLNLELEATETKFTTDQISGKSEVNVSITSTSYSKISGNVYGGGDLGQVGAGTISTSNNTADITNIGSTEVVIENGYIGGSVFGGGSGIPKNEEKYDIYMGTIFGTTSTTIKGGFVGANSTIVTGYSGGNVYGGGTQSRLYKPKDYTGNVAEVNIIENTLPIVVYGSVFGGGDRGNSATTNASVHTTVGNVKVLIKGSDSGASKIFFKTGGVYGDGNLCLVNGQREIEIQDFTTGTEALKTFFSLQRADVVNLVNADIVLLGAKDLVEEGDSSEYSINRIGEVNLKEGSTIKLDQLVKFMGSVVSDQFTDRVFIDPYDTGLAEKLKQTEIDSYIDGILVSHEDKNVICIANGLYLEIIDEDTKKYGSVYGLFTLQLLIPNEGEGGGFVYANAGTSTGDFICETLMSNIDGIKSFMPVVNNLGGTNVTYGEEQYWFIQGKIINYSLAINGYIGSDVQSYEKNTVIPTHSTPLSYAFDMVEVNDVLRNAIVSNKYTLVAKNSGLEEQEIALELRINSKSLFLVYVDGKWGLSCDGNVYDGYNENIYKIGDNILMPDVVVDDSNDKISIILHKSEDVNAEVTNMQARITITMNVDSGEGTYQQFDGPNTLNFNIGFSIVRLVPVQDMYQGTSKNYSGLHETLEHVNITLGSSLTVEYQTKYIPSAFPDGINSMSWFLRFETYSYYIDSLGNYLTVDINDKVINISQTLTRDPDVNTKTYLEKDGDKYSYTHDGKLIEMQQLTVAQKTYLPRGTKVTLVDLSNEDHPGYYYYIHNPLGDVEDVTEVNLADFMYMGTNTKINSSKMPEFMKLYLTGEATRVTERLIFIFDFEKAELSGTTFKGNIVLEHQYDSVDIMDYVKSETNNDRTTYSRAYPKVSEYNINLQSSTTGIVDFDIEFDQPTYDDDTSAILNVNITKDSEWTNTKYDSTKIGIKIEAPSDGKLPDGIEFIYNGISYRPMNKNKYVIIPVNGFGIHQIEVKNMLGTIETTTSAEFIATLMYLPENQHYNENLMLTDKVIDSNIKCEIIPIDRGSMKVDVNTNVVEVGGYFNVNIQLENTSTNLVTLEIWMKDANGKYQRLPINLASLDGNKVHIMSTAQYRLQKGTYRIVFRNGTLEEVISIVVI